MKKLFKKLGKFIGYIIVIIVISFIGYKSFDGWQDYRNTQAIIGSPQGQLPELASPLNYNIHLNISPEEDEFSGNVSIEVVLHKETDHFWIHGSEFEILNSQLVDQSGKIHPVVYTELGHSGVVRIDLGSMFTPQKIFLKLDFQREFSTELAGLYKVITGDVAGVFTQFEAIDARLAFPSFDEPRFKVPFELSMTIPHGLTGISNTPEIGREILSDNRVKLKFAQTKPLPTYLVAVAVGDFDIVKGKDIPANIYRDYPLPVRAFALKGKGKELSFALKQTEEIVLSLEKYFGRGYPYQKLDFIAVPDFSAGAMENAGLITYREQILLIGDDPTIAQKRFYFQVHAHELAHQWFGNLVTMKWWDDIWLNESFADWMEGKVVAEIHPELRTDEGLTKNRHRVMTSDSYVAVRQIREPIKNNGDIENAFDSITYTKGGAILNMFENYLGEEAFRKGVQLHMQRFEFGSADVYDFIQSLSDATLQPEIVNAFNSFLSQPGVPLINFDWQCDSTDPNKQIAQVTFQLNQSRYLPLGSKGSADKIWKLPICIAAINDDIEKSRSEQCFMMTEKEMTHSFSMAQCPVTISPNNNGDGYYRWTISSENWHSLLANLPAFNTDELISINSNLLSDLRAGRIEPEIVIDSAEKFVQLNDYASKTLPVKGLTYLAEYIANPEDKKAMTSYLKGLYLPLITELGLEADSQLDKSSPALAANLRSSLLELFALKLKDKNIRETLKARAIQYIGYQTDYTINEEAINKDLAELALSVAVQELGRPFFYELKNQLDKSTDGALRGKLLHGMSATTDPELSEEVLGLILSTDTRLNEKSIMIFDQMAMAETRDTTYEWFKGKYSVISMFLPSRYMAYAPRIGMPFCDQAHYQDLYDFFVDEVSEVPGSERHFKNTLEQIEVCSAIKASIPKLVIPGDYD